MLHLIRDFALVSTLVVLNLIATHPLVAQLLQEIEATPTDRFQDDQWTTRDFWMTTLGKAPGDNWQFADGEVRLLAPSGGSGSLLSPPVPKTFELSFQWKIEEATNSGLKYRVRRFGSRWLGIEYQIMDEPIVSDKSHKGATASIYDLVAPDSQRTLHPPGQWNSARIVVDHDRLEHYLNDKLVASTQTRGAAWEQAIAFSKFYGLPEFGQPAAGDRIMLTDHGGRVAYKDFQMRSIQSQQRSVSAAAGSSNAAKSIAPQLANAFRNSWADQNSIVLWSRTTALPEMVKEGPAFLKLSNDEVRKLSELSDERELVSRQLPSGASLDLMQGACPGAPGEIQLTYFPVHQRDQMTTIPWQTTRPDNGYTIQWNLQDLQPGTEYAAVIEARPIGRTELSSIVRGSFQTAPAVDKLTDLRFCLTTCHDYVRRDDGDEGHKIYSAMAACAPDFVIHAGDIEYYDHTSPWGWTLNLMRFKWNRLFALPRNRQFYANTTSYFIKDDHDTLKNDCHHGQRYGSVTFEQGRDLFNLEQFPSRQARYQTVSWGKDLQIWILEGRDFRSDNRMPDGPDKTILGVEQKRWLFETLEQSNATFKLIFSPTPIVGPDRPSKQDNHANENFQFEGEQLRAKFATIPGLIIFCGDRHWQYASVDRENGLWEFGCGPGSEVHQLGWKGDDVRPEHQFLRVAGGFLSGQLVSHPDGPPALTLRHHQVTGEKVSEFVFP